MAPKIPMEVQEFIKHNGNQMTLLELMHETGLTYAQLYDHCHKKKITPIDSGWNKKYWGYSKRERSLTGYPA